MRDELLILRLEELATGPWPFDDDEDEAARAARAATIDTVDGIEAALLARSCPQGSRGGLLDAWRAAGRVARAKDRWGLPPDREVRGRPALEAEFARRRAELEEAGRAREARRGQGEGRIFASQEEGTRQAEVRTWSDAELVEKLNSREWIASDVVRIVAQEARGRGTLEPCADPTCDGVVDGD